MFLFKTSGATFDSVIANQAHASRGEPKDWEPGELILVSKNRSDLGLGEKQIAYTMRFKSVRKLLAGEAEALWPGNEGRWNCIIECLETTRLAQPFDLSDVLTEEEVSRYNPIITFGKLSPAHELKVCEFLERHRTAADPGQPKPESGNTTPVAAAEPLPWYKVKRISYLEAALYIVAAAVIGATLF